MGINTNQIQFKNELIKLFDVKTLKNVNTQSGWINLCSAERQDLSKSVCPTVYNKLYNSFKAIDKQYPQTLQSRSMTGASPAANAEVIYNENNEQLYIVNQSNIYKISSLSPTFTKTDIAYPENCNPIGTFQTDKLAVILTADKAGFLLFDFETETFKKFTITFPLPTVPTSDNFVFNFEFKLINNKIYMINELGKIWVFDNSFDITQNDIVELDFTENENCQTYGFICDICYHETENMFYMVSHLFGEDYFHIHKTPNIENLNSYTWNFSQTLLNNIIVPGWNGNHTHYGKSSHKYLLYFYNNKIFLVAGTRYPRENDFSSFFAYDNLAFYKSNDGINFSGVRHFTSRTSIIVVTRLKQLGHLVIFNADMGVTSHDKNVRLGMNLETETEITNYKAQGGGYTDLGGIYQRPNGDFYAKEGSYIRYMQATPIQYTDTYTINGNSVTVNYYKAGNLKFIVPNTNNDNNVQAVYNALGYTPYYRIDLTNETFSLPRENKKFVYMYIGDNYNDTASLSGDCDIEAKKTDIAELQTQINTLTTNLNTLSNNYTALEARVAALENPQQPEE